MIRILKLIFTSFITTGLLVIATWFFLRNSILENFSEESRKIQNQISILTDPKSGKESMEKYLAYTGNLIYHQFSVPLFPLIKEIQKDEMKGTVSERIGDFRKKLEQMDNADPAARVVAYNSVVRSFNEHFPDKSSTIEETLKITITGGVNTYENRGNRILEKAREISGSSKIPVIRDIEKKEEKPDVPIKTKIKNENTSVLQAEKNKAEDEDRNIPLSRAGDYIGMRVYVYLITGRQLEGFIKMQDAIYLHLDIEFKGGIFTAKVFKKDIDKIIKVKESSIFKYLREQKHGR